MRTEIIGDCVLYNADCRDVLPTLDKVDAVVTDPPYGILSQSGSAATRRSGGNLNNGICDWDIAPSKDDLTILINSCKNVVMWGGAVIWSFLLHLDISFGISVVKV